MALNSWMVCFARFFSLLGVSLSSGEYAPAFFQDHQAKQHRFKTATLRDFLDLKMRSFLREGPASWVCRHFRFRRRLRFTISDIFMLTSSDSLQLILRSCHAHLPSWQKTGHQRKRFNEKTVGEIQSRSRTYDRWQNRMRRRASRGSFPSALRSLSGFLLQKPTLLP